MRMRDALICPADTRSTARVEKGEDLTKSTQRPVKKILGPQGRRPSGWSRVATFVRMGCGLRDSWSRQDGR